MAENKRSFQIGNIVVVTYESKKRKARYCGVVETLTASKEEDVVFASLKALRYRPQAESIRQMYLEDFNVKPNSYTDTLDFACIRLTKSTIVLGNISQSLASLGDYYF